MIFLPGVKKTVLISGPAGQQELLIAAPKENAKSIVCIISHPHPVHGGTMHNKVVYTLASVMDALAVKTVRYNFRGVQKSEGVFDQGRGELSDLLNVIDWVNEFCPHHEIWLAGFSFGAFIALKAHHLSQIKKLILVAPPVGQIYFSDMPKINCPCMLIQGGEDEIIDSKKVMAWADEQNPSLDIVYLPRAGHFFHAQLLELKEILLSHIFFK